MSPASDNAAVLADISGTVIETNAVWFEGPAFLLRPKGQGAAVGGGGLPGLVGVTWGDLLRCQGLGANIGADCFGVAEPAVRYDSPTWGGFRFETSYGKMQLTGPLETPGTGFNGQGLGPILLSNGTLDFIDSSDNDFWDIAAFYTGDWNSIKLSVAASYTWIETAVRPLIAGSAIGANSGTDTEGDLFQVGTSIMHKPSGLGIYGYYQHESTGGANLLLTTNAAVTAAISNPDTDVWYVKPFWRKTWMPLGATVLFGEYGQYNDQFGAAEINFCGVGFALTTTTGNFCGTTVGVGSAYVTESEIQRWGLGVVQEIDSAAMHLWLRWQHQEFEDLNLIGSDSAAASPCVNGCRFKQSFDDWDLFQVGGIIFF